MWHRRPILIFLAMLAWACVGTTRGGSADSQSASATTAATSGVRFAAGASPVYPAELRQSGIAGEALVEFVVDTTGMADVRTAKVLRTTHPAFGAAVLEALPRMRFIPAQKDGVKVPATVKHPFVFALEPMRR